MSIILHAFDYWNLLPCPQCGNRDFSNPITNVIDSLDVGVGVGITLEEEYLCPKCECVYAYWAHGSFQPPENRRQLVAMRWDSIRYRCHRAMLTHWGYSETYWGRGI